jgi:tetratricopeptide (TPR) repeat protein
MGRLDLRQRGTDVLLRVAVQPRASRDAVVGLHGTALKLQLSAPPAEGAASPRRDGERQAWRRSTAQRRWLWCLLLLAVLACARQPRAPLLAERLAAQELVHLGQLYASRGEPERALQAYRQAVQLHPGYVPAWIALGDWHYVRQEYAAAEAVYKKILTLDPRLAEIYHNLCWVYLATQRNLDEAESLIHQALALHPFPRDWYLDTQAMIWLRQGKYEQALRPLREAIDLTPATAQAALAARYRLLAETYRRLGRDRDAQWADERAVEAQRIGVAQ